MLSPSSFQIEPLRPLSKGPPLGLNGSVLMSIAAWQSALARGSSGAWTRGQGQEQVRRVRGGILNRRSAFHSAFSGTQPLGEDGRKYDTGPGLLA